jgi:hypothetical protein
MMIEVAQEDKELIQKRGGARVSDIQDEAYSEACDEIKRLKALLTRAADALERVDKNWPNEDYGADAPLIKKLRKAASE